MCEITEVWDADTLTAKAIEYKTRYSDAWIGRYAVRVADAGYELQRITQRIGGIPTAIDPLNGYHIRWQEIVLIHKQAWLVHEGITPGEPTNLNGFENKYKNSMFGFGPMTAVAEPARP